MNTVKEFVEKTIDRLEEEKEKGIYDSDSVISVKDAWRKSIKIVNQMAEEYVPDINAWKWIPCSDRLPEEEGNYLVFLDRWNVITFSKFKNVMGYKHFDNGYVIAWQPLPNPYKPEQQKEIPTKHYEERFNRVM